MARVTLRVKVSAPVRAAARRLARARTLGSLERMLAAFVGDAAQAAQQPGSREAQRVHAWLDACYGPPELLAQVRELYGANEDDLWR